MNKAGGLFIAFILGIILSLPFHANADNGPAEIILRSTIDASSKPKLAFFPHDLHQNLFECSQCHHSEGGINIAKCETCHNKAAEATGMPNKLNTFKKVGHELCRGCHKSLSKEGKKAGPTKCNGCHRKDLK